MTYKKSLLVLVSFLIFLFDRVSNVTGVAYCQTNACNRAGENLRDSIDLSVDPCDDFFKFACGNWAKKHPVKTEFISSSVQSDRVITNTRNIIKFLNESDSEAEPKAVHKARKLFSLCVDTDTIDKKRINHVANFIRLIGVKFDSSFDLPYSIIQMHKLLATDIFFSLAVAPDPYDQEINRIGVLRPISDSYSLLPSFYRNVKTLSDTLTKRQYMSLALASLYEYNNDSIHTIEQFSPYNSSDDQQIFVSRIIHYANLLASKILFYSYSYKPQVTSNVYPDLSNINSIITLQNLQNLTDRIAAEHNATTFNWTDIIESSFGNTTRLNLNSDTKIVSEIPYISDILTFIFSTPLNDHAAGILWTLIDRLAPYSSTELRSLKDNYTSDFIGLARDEWCANSVSQILGMAVSYYYANDPDYAVVKSQTYNVTQQIHKIFEEILKNTTWMDPITKEKALNKTELMRKYVAFPDSIKTKDDLDEYYKDLEITDDFLESVLLNIKKEVIKNYNSVHTKNNLNFDRRYYTPVMANAFYDPERNTIIIPAAILGFPFIDNGIEALNFGAIGMVIGHEITHGFDKQGRKYNSIGNLEEWWQKDTLKEFEKRAYCFETVYNNYTEKFEDTIIWTDGSVTLSENIADNGGFKAALLAYRQYMALNANEETLLPIFGDRFSSEQLFTLGFAQVWCENLTQLDAILAPTLNHSPNGIRVAGVVKNSQLFADIWHCTKGTNMNPDVKKCSLW